MEEVAKDPNVNLDLIMDIDLPISVRFGQTEMLLEQVLRLGNGSIIELDRSVDEPVDLLVNNRLLARGEVVITEGHYAIRITQVESPAERIRSLGS
jgi:flagellar motor switch protein FliN/FliY